MDRQEQQQKTKKKQQQQQPRLVDMNHVGNIRVWLLVLMMIAILMDKIACVVDIQGKYLWESIQRSLLVDFW